MPTQWAHGFYWEYSDTAVTPVIPSQSGYPAWQASVVTPSLFGWFQVWWDWAVDLVRLYRRLKALDPERRQTVLYALSLVEHTTYPLAQQAVRQTAQTLGFNQPQAWVKLSHTLKDHRGWAENSWRHLKAMHLLDEAAKAQGSTLTNPERNILTELAYVGFGIKGK